MELAIKNLSVPMRGYPQKELEDILNTQFRFWLANTFRIKTENAGSLQGALEGVKEHCWSMGFAEIKKAFEMYADSKLNLEPVSGFMDRVLVGKIIKSYKASLPTPKVPRIEAPEISQDEKNKLLENGVLECYQHFLEYGNIKEGKAWVYGYLVEQGKINDTPEFKRECMVKAKANLINDSKDIKKLDDRKSFVAKLEGKKNGQVITEAKRISLIQHFQNQ